MKDCIRDCKTKMRGAKGFTILELLVAMAVLAILVVMLLGIVDSATKLWRGSESRVDSYREARAALSLLARDLQSAIPTTNTNYFRVDDSTLLPNGASSGSNASTIFFMAALPTNAQWADGLTNKSDLCQVGYFVGLGKTSVAQDSTVIKTMNLYRYFIASDDSYKAIVTNFGAVPFPKNLDLLNSKVELVARDVVSFSIRGYGVNTNGTGYLTNHTAAPGAVLPDEIEITLTAINQEVAKRLRDSDWVETHPSVKQNLQSFTTRVRLPKNVQP